MGYSCSTKARLKLDALMVLLKAGDRCPTNVWEANGKSYFYEVGREQPDGAITGSVQRFVADDRCVPAGRFRVSASGIERFPGTPSRLWSEANRIGDAEYERVYSDGRNFLLLPSV